MRNIHDRTKAASIHLFCSASVAGILVAMIFSVWFPSPFGLMTGGIELFLLIIIVDVVCGALLTFSVFTRKKSKKELLLDMTVIIFIQIFALSYGLWSLQKIRPLYLVHEFDRFKVISSADVDPSELRGIREDLKIGIFGEMRIVSIRAASKEEREEVLFESVQGGRDYGERPKFYTEYSGIGAYQSASRAIDFLQKPQNIKYRLEIEKILTKNNVPIGEARYLPIVARTDWIAIIKADGTVIGYIQGDAF